MRTETTKVKVWKMERDGQFLAVDRSALDAIIEDMECMEEGDSFTITVEEWDKADLDALPEFDGW